MSESSPGPSADRVLLLARGLVLVVPAVVCFGVPWLVCWCVSMAWHGARAGWRDAKDLAGG